MSKMSIEPRVAIAPLPPVAAPAPRRIALSGATMGSRWSALFWSDDPGLDTCALGSRLQAVVDQVDAEMSTWRPDSDLERLNAAPVGAWVPVPPSLLTVLAAALEIGRLSDGAFDIGVGDLVRAFGFGGGSRMPDGARIADLLGRPAIASVRTLQLDAPCRRARKLAPVTIDLSGIAKGFGVDELARVLTAAGLRSWLVGIDGEMRAAGTKPDGQPFAVAHERPVPGAREVLGVLALADAAVATSGTYRHQHRINGHTVSHTMDPATGAPLSNDLASVTVLAGTAMEADAWATALMVRGAVGGRELARRRGVQAIFVQADGTVTDTLS